MSWSVHCAKDTYAIDHWGEGYFDVNPAGQVMVYPRRDPALGKVDLFEAAQAVRQEGLAMPVLLRFTDILRDRVQMLHKAFGQARAEYAYRGGYTAVYPIKVNQQRRVVETILHSQAEGVGLEAGSKSELLAVMALSQDNVVICNGYKDRHYIRLALIGRRLGLRIYIVIEKFSELAYVIEEARALGVQPLIGVRVRLASIGAGKWQNSGGEKSKFGLTAHDLLHLVQTLRSADLLSCLKLMHFHMGSQIANIGDVKTALREAGRYYAELRALQAEIEFVDVGGGLGVDYEGTRSVSDCSMNYNIAEYALNIVRGFAEICAEQNLPHPHLITEAGRAMTAHHAVLVTNVIEVERLPDTAPAPMESASPELLDLQNSLERLERESVLGVYHDAQFDLHEIRALYVQGKVGLAELAQAEHCNAVLCQQAHKRLDNGLRAHRELLDQLNERLADKVFCNFSLFQSLPDAWAINQIFPVMPLHRLTEEPTRRGVVQDLTCDSDGHIDDYIERQSIEKTLRLHYIGKHETYLLGIFLVGAYQEILGDMHNLFGDTHSVNIELDGVGGYRFVEPEPGDDTDDLLRYVHLEPEELERLFRKKLADAALPNDERKLYESELVAGLNAYTYLED